MALDAHVKSQSLGTLLEIERARGSEACPDTDAVYRAIARLFPERTLRPSSTPTDIVANARVRIRPISIGHEALVTVTQPRVGERVILENDADCHGLADALAVALVMLVDPPKPLPATAVQRDASIPPIASAESVPTSVVSPPTPARPKEALKKSAAESTLPPPAGGSKNGARPS